MVCMVTLVSISFFSPNNIVLGVFTSGIELLDRGTSEGKTCTSTLGIGVLVGVCCFDTRTGHCVAHCWDWAWMFRIPR